MNVVFIIIYSINIGTKLARYFRHSIWNSFRCNNIIVAVADADADAAAADDGDAINAVAATATVIP